MAHAFRIMNVFTVDGDRLSGNPLCVFEDARGLSDSQMQALARQMNLSETTFVLPPRTPGTDAHVRIFTPGFEMPFAGHPTLGTADVVGRGRDDVALEVKAGIVPVTRAGDAWTLKAARAPETRPVEASRAELAQMLGLGEGAISDEPLWVSTGVEQLVIPVATVDDVRAARPVPELLQRWGFSAARDEAMAYVWARDAADARALTVRFFFTSHGSVIEDPATGSACANLGGWMIATNQPLPVELTLRQGDAVERPSRLGLRVAADRGIYVTGAVIELGRGTVEI
ncbi:MAG: PhzF family phenazine biosynthesis protein [Deltaproteobacteria bacterium]|nr:PhzF family phenazine biosynthesis protein [Deltaproteobacteria bacterium]